MWLLENMYRVFENFHLCTAHNSLMNTEENDRFSHPIIFAENIIKVIQLQLYFCAGSMRTQLL
jgi:hypothetical protein